MQELLYTIGHSTHTLAYFIGLLARHRISLLADVRAAPYSSYNPQYNREVLSRAVMAEGIAYGFYGNGLSAKRAEPACYVNGKVSYELVAKTPSFQDQLQRLKKDMKVHTIAIMCAERDPLCCHRTHLVAPHLVREGVAVMHILTDGRLMAHEDLPFKRPKTKPLEPDLFESFPTPVFA